MFGVMGMNPAESLLEMVCPDGLDAIMDPEGNADANNQEEGKEDQSEF